MLRKIFLNKKLILLIFLTQVFFACSENNENVVKLNKKNINLSQDNFQRLEKIILSIEIEKNKNSCDIQARKIESFFKKLNIIIDIDNFELETKSKYYKITFEKRKNSCSKIDSVQ